MSSISETLKKIKEENYSPFYLLVGKEKFFHDQIINVFTKQLFKDSSSKSLNKILLHGSDYSLSDVVKASLSYPMLSNYKLVVVKEFFRIKAKDTDAFLRYIEKPTNSTILILSAEQSGKTNFFKEVKKKAVHVDCNPLPEYKIPALIKDRLNEKKIKMTSEAVAMLAQYTGNSLLTIEHELDKVKEYKSDNSEINNADIIAVTGMSKEHNVFALQKALISKNLKKSFTIAKSLIEKGENINLIFSVLFGFFKNAMLVSKLLQSGNARQLKINEYQRRDITQALKIFNQTQLEEIINLFHLLDKKIKRSVSKDWAILQALCFTICS